MAKLGIERKIISNPFIVVRKSYKAALDMNQAMEEVNCLAVDPNIIYEETLFGRYVIGYENEDCRNAANDQYSDTEYETGWIGRVPVGSIQEVFISKDINLEMTEQGKKDKEFIQSVYDSGLGPGYFFGDCECLHYINSEPNDPNVLECKDKMLNE